MMKLVLSDFVGVNRLNTRPYRLVPSLTFLLKLVSKSAWDKLDGLMRNSVSRTSVFPNGV